MGGTLIRTGAGRGRKIESRLGRRKRMDSSVFVTYMLSVCHFTSKNVKYCTVCYMNHSDLSDSGELVGKIDAPEETENRRPPLLLL